MKFVLTKGSFRGEVPEWPNGTDSKSVVPKRYRGFESLLLRHCFTISAQLRQRATLANGRSNPKIKYVYSVLLALT